MKIRSAKRFGIPFLTGLLLTATSLVALVNIGGTSVPTQVSASASSFSGRTTSVDLAGDDFPVTATPAITILTHGLGGSASHWSNNSDDKFSYDNRSLIERLRDKNGANVFWAKMSSATNFDFYVINKLNQLAQYETSSLNTVTQLTSSYISKHIIIVFEASYDARTGSHNAMYNEFKKMTLSVAHDYGYITGGIYPKINLIGHSRGGLTNMDFANHYPRLISDMFSMGTPFNGSNFGRVNLFADMVAGHIDSEVGTALYDINNVTLQNRLKNEWAANQQNGRGSHIRFFPMSGYSTLGMIADVAGGVWGTIASTLLGTFGPANFAAVVTIVSTIIWGVESGKDYPQTDWTIINDAFYSAFSGWAFLWTGRNTEIHDDLLVHRDSQRANGYIEITDSYEKKFLHDGIFWDENFDASRTAVPNFAIVHNLEPRDDDFINWIVSKIDTNINIFDTSIHGNEATINGFANNITIPTNFSLVIPSNIWINGQSKLVTEISSHAFADNNSIVRISLPSSLRWMGVRAFGDCHNLTSVFFEPNSNLNSINDYAFQNCTNLTQITIPASVTWIGNHAFYNCESLTIVSFPSNSQLGVINDYAFQYCENLSIVQIPASVVLIGNRAFQYCPNLSSITFDPNGELSLLGPWGFQSCVNITNITIPAGVKTIPEGLFAGCTNLTNVTFLGPVETIEKWAFYNCISLDNVLLPNSLTTIKDYAFQNCTSLSSITIPSSTVHIWPNAFAGCTNLNIHYENIALDTLLPSQYGFANQYNNEPIAKTVTSSEGNSVTTRRLRTGYINANDGTGRKFLTMSGKAAGQYEAYMEYEYNHPVESIDYQLALWGPNETLIQNSSIRLEAKNEFGNWQTIRTFSASQMGQNKESLIDYESFIGFSTYSFRFIIQTTHNITNSNNVGRVVIGDVIAEGNHECNHETSNAQVPYDEDYHMTYCYCGSSQLMPHTMFTYHPIISGQTYNYNVHEKKCSCGHITYEAHTWVYATGLPGMGYVYCADCLLALIP